MSEILTPEQEAMVRDQWRQVAYPHHDRETFERFFADLSAHGWDEVRHEFRAVVATVAASTEALRTKLTEVERERDVEADRDRLSAENALLQERLTLCHERAAFFTREWKQVETDRDRLAAEVERLREKYERPKHDYLDRFCRPHGGDNLPGPQCPECARAALSPEGKE